MTKASDNLFPKILADMNTSSPAAPSDRSWKWYAKADGFYARSSNGEVKIATGSPLSNPMTTTGDMIYSLDNSGTAARRAIGSNGNILRPSGGIPAWGALLTVDATLAADVTMTNANQLYDGSAASFLAGVWAITWKIAVATAGTNTHEYAGRLWDGSTIYDESQVDSASIAASFIFTVSGSAIVALSATTTLKISVSDIRALSVIKRDVNPIAGGAGSNHTATRLVGVRIG